MKRLADIKISTLDLVPVRQDAGPAQSLRNSLDLAQHVEKLGYNRFWVAEHHNMDGIASSATAVLLGYLAGGTSTIRVGAGGVMLPNHAPLVIAEQFGTLESLYPSRIDLGLGRAPGTDRQTMLALRRDINNDGSDFPMMLEQLQYFLSDHAGTKGIKAVPGYGLDIPIWLLGSSTFSAQLAAEKGLPFAFASHFAPDAMEDAIRLYRANFKPSSSLQEPYIIICINVICAETMEQAHYLATSELQKFLHLQRGDNSLLCKPTHDMSRLWEKWEETSIRHKTRESIWGTPAFVKEKLESLAQRTGANEVMINSMIHNPEERIKSYELISRVWFE